MNRSSISRCISILAYITLSYQAFSENSEYSNVQDGVRIRILNYDQDTPTLRIENNGNETLAVRNDVTMGVSFWDGKEKVRGKPLLMANGVRQENIDQIAIIGPGACLEVPLRGIYFDAFDPGDGKKWNWAEGLRQIPAGKHSVIFSTNGLGISVLNVNVSPFKVNFTIPGFSYTVR